MNPYRRFVTYFFVPKCIRAAHALHRPLLIDIWESHVFREEGPPSSHVAVAKGNQVDNAGHYSVTSDALPVSPTPIIDSRYKRWGRFCVLHVGGY